MSSNFFKYDDQPNRSKPLGGHYISLYTFHKSIMNTNPIDEIEVGDVVHEEHYLASTIERHMLSSKKVWLKDVSSKQTL